MRSPHSRFPKVLILALVFCACGKSSGIDPNAGGPIVPDDNATEAPTDLSYGQRVFVLGIGESIPPETPTVTGTVSNWSITPPLPGGLVFNSVDGSISGAAIAYSVRSNHLVAATNSVGSDEMQLLVQVGGASRFAFAGSSTDGSMSVLAPTSGGADMIPHTWSPSTGSALQDSAISKDGKVICAVSDDSLVVWQVNNSTGYLTETGSLNLGSDTHSVAIHPSGLFAFVTSQNVQSVRAFSINSQSGVPSLVNQIDAGSRPEQIVMDPLGRFVVVRQVFNLSSSSTPTRSYTISQSTGAITHTATFNILTVSVTHMALGVLGESLYLSIDLPQESVLHCTVDTTTGKPALVGLTNAGTGPSHVRPAPDGKRLYVANAGSNSVTLMNINQENGSLGHDGSLVVDNGLSAMSFSFDGNELYIMNAGAQELTIKSLNADTGQFDDSNTLPVRPGSLVLLPSSGPQAISKTLLDVFALNQQSGNITAYSVDSGTGQLTENGAPVDIRGAQPTDLAVDPSGKYLFACSQLPNSIETYALQADGSLVNLFQTTDLFGATPQLMCVDPSGHFVYIAETNLELVLSYTVQADGSLAASGSLPLAGNPTSITTNPSGEFLYVTMRGDGSVFDGEIRTFAINSADGRLSATDTLAAAGGPSSISFNSSGTRAYATMHVGNTAHTYMVRSDGRLLEIATGTSTQPEPQHVVLSHDDRFAYVAFEDGTNNGGLLLYDVDSNSGELSVPQWVDSEGAGVDPSQVILSPDSTHAYVLARGSESIIVFDISQLDGRVTFLQQQPLGLAPERMAERRGIQ